ncbi:MAG: 1-(5-phosphoribosyl)-5-[Candidatus Methanomethylophilaceae archaeon]|nr:1-(5-phosphoribosyl)-5-[(5-phosphoribosylamino)methylideneamino] imidazole-4-carboxamide isomerase [Thermoplasmata archaeon]MBQ2762215.1 1-(5-phosphoribosyl)-5-[(5-phosphoribosylamino)methylideneamino] imidazole-4-carboxamide isomerase [Candidatus Methanomethylophilaceae archaeon]
MKIIPAIDMMDHQVVQLVGGVPGTEKIKLPNPVDVAMSWVDKGAKYLHLVDLDAAFGNEDNLDTIREIASVSSVPVEVGGGIKKESTIRRLLDAGVDRVIVGTRAINDTEWLSEMSLTFPDRLVLALDTKGGQITVKGWQENAEITLDRMMYIIKELPLAAVLNTNVDVEGQGKGIDEKWVSEFSAKCPHKIIASGGVTSQEDAKILSGYGIESAVVGVSIYTGLMEPWNWDTPWEA